MKKILLSAAAIFAAMSLNAQIIKLDAETLGITDSDTGNDVAAGFEWGKIDGAITVSNAFDTKHKPVNCKNDDFDKVIIDGNEISTAGGVQGQDNPKDADGNNPAVSLKEQVSGAVVKITAEKEGWVYIVAKLSTNKQYVVFENGAAIGYKIAMENADERVEGGVLNLEVKGSGEYNNVTLEDYPSGLAWVIREYLGDAEAATAGNGLGVLYFPVYPDCEYLASATGSKISWSGVYFSENEAASVSLAGEKDGVAIAKTLIGEGGTTPVVEEKVYSIIGTLVGNWDVDTDLTKNESGLEGLYETVFENVAAGSYEVKFRQDHDWTINWGVGGAQDGDNIKVEVEKDGSQVVVLFDPATGEYSINVVAPGEPAGDILSLIDKFTGCWNNAETATANADGTITYNAKQWGGIAAWLAGDTPADYSAYDNIVFEFAEATPCAVQGFVQPGNGGENKLTWIEAGTTKAVCALGDDKAAINQIALQCAEDATLTITRIYLEKADASAINAVKAAAQDSDAIYNIAGQKVSASYKGLVIKNGKKYIQK